MKSIATDIYEALEASTKDDAEFAAMARAAASRNYRPYSETEQSKLPLLQSAKADFVIL